MSDFVILVDADACPVKDEIYKVAERRGARVYVVSNSFMQIPRAPFVERVIVPAGPDVADDWIAERAGPGDIAITSDVPLASRCVKRGARVIAHDGRPFTQASIGNDLATRNLMTTLRETGQMTGGGRPFTKQDRSRFLGALDTAIQAIKRAGK